jgi:hypothetical protein
MPPICVATAKIRFHIHSFTHRIPFNIDSLKASILEAAAKPLSLYIYLVFGNQEINLPPLPKTLTTVQNHFTGIISKVLGGLCCGYKVEKKA